MKLDFCAVCGVTTDLHQHHIEPVIMSGVKRKKLKGYDSNKKLKDCEPTEVFAWLFDQGIISDDGEITVCSYHHHLIHGIVKFQLAEHHKLIREGQQKARARGVKFGRPTKQDDQTIFKVKELRDSGIGIKKIAKDLNLGVGTIYSIMEKTNEPTFADMYKDRYDNKTI